MTGRDKLFILDNSNSQLNQNIHKALRIYGRAALHCLNDPEIAGLLREFRDLIRETDSVLLESGVVLACTKCACEKGSCCFGEMGESYGTMGLLVNLLLGSKLPDKEDFPESCRFVGAAGCKLAARESFCLNYFCPGLKAFLGEEKIIKIKRQVGEQLFAGWKLELALARCIIEADTVEYV